MESILTLLGLDPKALADGDELLLHLVAGAAQRLPPARQRHQYDKSARRWYLPKLLHWLTFSFGNAIPREVARRIP
jgi:hypothetical protein